MKRGFLSANYTEPKADTAFKSFEVSVKEDGKKDRKILFNTGDPIYDYYAYERWMMNSDLDIVVHSSSVDHFFMDSNKYVQVHVLFDVWPPVKGADGKLMFWSEAEKLGHDTDKMPKVMALKKWKKFSQVKKYVHDKEDKEGIKVNPDFTITLKK